MFFSQFGSQERDLFDVSVKNGVSVKSKVVKTRDGNKIGWLWSMKQGIPFLVDSGKEKNGVKLEGKIETPAICTENTNLAFSDNKGVIGRITTRIETPMANLELKACTDYSLSFQSQFRLDDQSLKKDLLSGNDMDFGDLILREPNFKENVVSHYLKHLALNSNKFKLGTNFKSIESFSFRNFSLKFLNNFSRKESNDSSSEILFKSDVDKNNNFKIEASNKFLKNGLAVSFGSNIDSKSLNRFKASMAYKLDHGLYLGIEQKFASSPIIPFTWTEGIVALQYQINSLSDNLRSTVCLKLDKADRISFSIISQPSITASNRLVTGVSASSSFVDPSKSTVKVGASYNLKSNSSVGFKLQQNGIFNLNYRTKNNKNTFSVYTQCNIRNGLNELKVGADLSIEL